MDFIAISVLLLLLFAVTEASFCINKTQEMNCCEAVKIYCPDGQVIYRPDITASEEPCDSKVVSCMNRTIDLLVDISECYWKQSCTVGFPTTPMLGCESAVESLHVNNWKCVDKKENPKSVYGYICDNITDLGPEMTHGIIRSHESIPWKYGQNTFPFQHNNDNTGQYMVRCSKTIHLRRGMDEKFRVSVDFIDLDTENDQFTINGTTPYNGYNEVFTELDEKIVFNFTMNLLSTKGGSGFVICFKKLMKGEERKNSACDEIMTTKTAPVTEVRSSNPYSPKRGFSPKRNPDRNDKSSLDKICQSMMSLYSSSTMSPTIKPTSSIPTSDKDICDTCLLQKKIGKKCRRKCCNGQRVSEKCTATTNKPTCPENSEEEKKLCKKCRRNKKCNTRFREQCSNCCSGRNGNLKNCEKNGKANAKNRTGKDARGRKGRRGAKKN